ncbi:hypothetical protein BaRGS_00036889 [Batillaria attramentaria]|uniref:F-box domain-containing protein n=1 Tax=Batillaria attramentaria TaxID=370345 RepID=A0ABD0JAP4_9CAEN
MDVMLDVPYRCPRCGGTRTFSTLADLKSHMAEDHAYSAQRRQRLKIFDYNTPRFSGTTSGRHSPLLQSFLDEGKLLEEEVKAAKKQELSNKLERQNQALSKPKPASDTAQRATSLTRPRGRKTKVNFSTPPPKLEQPDSYLQETFSSLNNEIITQRHNNWRTADALYSTQDVLSGVEEAAEGRVSEQRNVIERLTQDLAEKERQIQGLRLELQRVKERDAAGTPARSLSSDSHVEDIRERQKLEDELARKKHELENLNTLLTEAKRDGSRKDERGGNTKRPRQKTEKGNQAEEGDVHDFGKGHVQSQRADASSLNTEDEAASDMSTSQASVSLSHSFGSSTKDRSNTLKKLKQNLVSRRSDISSQYSSTQSEPRQHVARPSRADQLQTQRLKDKKNALVEQMKELLTKATTENEKLKGELTAKENQLQVLNQQLERTKTDQTELMEETFDLYKEAENSLGKLKDMLKAKEAQLEQANTRMDEIRTEQEKLAAEKQNIALHADQKDSQYQNMLQERDEQISRLNHLLASQQEERDRLTEMAADLKREVQEKEKTQQDLSKAIADKEQELSKARDDVEALSTFLQTAAAKESVARGKLEAFVTELIDRADRAERELRHLRGLESSSSGNLTSDLSQTHPFQPNISGIPAASASGYTPMPPHGSVRHSTPMKRNSGGQQPQESARHILQTSREPWYNNLGATDLPTKPVRVGLPQDFTSPSQFAVGGSHVPNEFSGPYPPQAPHPPEVPLYRQPGEAQVFHPQMGVTYSDGVRVYPYMEPQPLPVSETSDEFAPLPPRNPPSSQHRRPRPSRPDYSGREAVDSPLYASALPSQRTRASASATQNEANPLSYQMYDVGQASVKGQEFVYSDGSSARPPDHHHYSASSRSARDSRPQAAHNRMDPLPPGVNPLPLQTKRNVERVSASSPARQAAGNLAKSPGKRSKAQSSQKVSRHDSLYSTGTLDGAKAISPDRTYTILSVTGEEARDVHMEPLSPRSYDSDHSGRSTPRNKPLHADHRPVWKEKVRPSRARVHSRQQGQMHTPEDSSTDGLELSIDDNGIMWEAANSFSDLSESYRMSPYGSETAGDVDSSVLLSTHSLTNQGVLKAQDTDDEVEIFDDADFLEATTLDDDNLDANYEGGNKRVQGRKTVLPLGERISKILKCVGKDDDDSEKQQPAGKSEMEKKFAAGKDSKPTPQPAERGVKPKRESPLERALAVQNRVKSLTFPRERKRSVTLSDTSTSELADKPADANREGKVARPVRKPRRKTESFLGSRSRRVEFEPMEEFSSSSYASVNVPSPAKREHSPTPIPQFPDKVQGREAHLSAELGGSARGGLGDHLRQRETTEQNSDRKAVLDEKDDSESQNASKSTAAQNTPPPAKPDRAGNFLQAAFSGIMQKIGYDTSDSAEKQAPATEDKHEESTPIVGQNPVTVISPLQRQSSVTTDESSDMKKYENADLVPAKQLRARFSQASNSSLQSSSDSLSPPMPRAQSPILPRPPSPQDKGDNDSTDFDLESDLEKFTAPGVGAGFSGMRRGLATGKPGGKKMAQKKTRAKRYAAAKNTQQLAAPDITDGSSSAVSDGDSPSKRQREERRRRRVALFRVFSYLDTKTLSRMALVCKEWQRVSRHPALWKNVHLKYDRISSQYLITISKWCTQLTSLTLEGLRAGSRRADETLDEYHRRTRGCLEPGLEELLKTSQDSLMSLSIIACGNILTEKLTYVSDTNPLTAEVMWALGGGCPSITSLMISPLFPCTNSEAMTNRCLLLLAQFYPDLQEVGVGGRALDVTGLLPLVQSCQRLQLLSLDHVKEMDDDTATALCRSGLRQLQRLEISGTPVTAKAIRTFYNSCRHLKEIKIVLSIADIFEDTRKKKNKEQYKKVKHSLEVTEFSL